MPAVSSVGGNSPTSRPSIPAFGMEPPRETKEDESHDDVAELPSLAHPHDGLFRYAFGRPEHAAGELAFALGEDIAQRIEWTTLELVAGSYVDEALRQSESDLLYSVRLGGHETLIYVLFEHQSSNDPWMPLRLLGYMHAIWARWVRDGATPERGLPAILPVVLHHGAEGWTAPRRFSELFRLADDARSVLSPHLVDFRFALDDLTLLAPDAVKARWSLTDFARLVLLLLQRARTSPDLLSDLAGFVSEIRALARTEAGRRDLGVAFRYALFVGDPPLLGLRRLLRDTAGARLEEEIVTTAEKLIAEGEARGRAEGEAKGEARGLAKGRGETLERQLRLEFGPLSDEVTRRLGCASIEELDRIAERILFAGTVEEVFGG